MKLVNHSKRLGKTVIKNIIPFGLQYAFIRVLSYFPPQSLRAQEESSIIITDLLITKLLVQLNMTSYGKVLDQGEIRKTL